MAETKQKMPSAAQWQKVHAELERFWQEEGDSGIKLPMHRDCRLAVIIPVYNEQPATLLRPLFSLAGQKQANFDEFEVIAVVNNSEQQAREKTPEFLVNQKILDFLSAVKAKKSGGEFLNNFNDEQKRQYAAVIASSLRVFAVDKSALSLAEKINHVAHARTRGCLEAHHRFFSVGRLDKGLVAFTDADCRFSENFVAAILQTFKQYPFLNGLSGIVEQEAAPDLPHGELIKRLFSLGRRPVIEPGEATGNIVKFQRKDKLERQVINNGCNIVVPVRSWLLCGGIPDRPSAEDYNFGVALANLPGDIAATDRYTVYQALRISERTGAGSLGRRVKKIQESFGRFLAGQSDKVLIPDYKQLSEFFKQLSDEARAGGLSGRRVLELMLNYGCDVRGLNKEWLDKAAKRLTVELSPQKDELDFLAIEAWILEVLDSRLPLRDVTHLVTKAN